VEVDRQGGQGPPRAVAPCRSKMMRVLNSEQASSLKETHDRFKSVYWCLSTEAEEIHNFSRDR
jgi:hypothetical protein